MKTKPKAIEQRAFPLAGVEVRAGADGEPSRIVGHAAVFDSLSEDLGLFREEIAPGAFTSSLAGDVRALWNHNSDYVLGRTKSGTLKLSEDEMGLSIEAIPPNTGWAQDALETMRRGDVDQMSFAFRTLNEEWRQDEQGPIRRLLEVELFEVSPVTFPAYPATDVAVRTIEDVFQSRPEQAPAGLPDGGGESQPGARLDLLRRRLDLEELE